jgi:hypothetical protein
MKLQRQGPSFFCSRTVRMFRPVLDGFSSVSAWWVVYVIWNLLQILNWIFPKWRRHICQQIWFIGAFAKLVIATVSFVVSVCPPAWNNSAPSGLIFIKFGIWFFRKSIEKIQVLLNLTRITKTLRKQTIRICYHISLNFYYNEIRLRQICRENHNPHAMFSNFFFSKIVPFMRLMWKKVW